MFYDDYSENQVSAQIVMVVSSIALVLSITSIQRGNKGTQQVEHFRQVPRRETALFILICMRQQFVERDSKSIVINQVAMRRDLKVLSNIGKPDDRKGKKHCLVNQA